VGLVFIRESRAELSRPRELRVLTGCFELKAIITEKTWRGEHNAGLTKKRVTLNKHVV